MNKRLIIFGLLAGILALFSAVKTVVSPTLTEPRWKVYQNPKYNFSFSYPSSWQVEQWDLEQAAKLVNVPDGTILYQGRFFAPSMDSTSSPQAGSGHFEVLIWENKNKSPVRQWLTWFRHEDLILTDLPAKENESLAGMPAIRYLQKQTSRKKPILYFFLNKDNYIFELLCEREDLKNFVASNSAGLTHPLYDKILQSWHFGVY